MLCQLDYLANVDLRDEYFQISATTTKELLLYPTHNSYKTMINRHHFIIIIIINAIRPMSHLCGISIFRICSV